MPSPVLPGKRPPADVEVDFANKTPRLEAPEDFAGAQRRKAAGSSRTGQACDRCKVRKIRCDARPGGCSPCAQNQTECKTTDRITGRATSRGHTENLENQITNLKLYMIELQAQLKENGIEPRPQPAIGETFATASATQFPSFGQSNTHPPLPTNDAQAAQEQRLPEFRPGCIGDNYLGVSSENSFLSPIEGTSLALFGTKIDLAEFIQPESDPSAQATSYPTFLRYAFGKSTPPVAIPQLPDHDACKTFADWYFRSVTAFAPIIHRPDMFRLLDEIFIEGYQPTPAETVMVHLMLAMMHFQMSARNGDEQGRDTYLLHYHYCLGFIPTLIESHKLEDLQALTLICSQLRSHQRPGAAWMFTNMVLGIAIESGLHRSARAWESSTFTAHEIEMRKRVFWTLFMFHVALSGKLGRPIPLRSKDIDIEFPEPVHDIMPGESNVPKWRKCSFRAGIQGFKLLKILMEVHSSIYSIRATNGIYEVKVRQIEKDLEAFQAQLPIELSMGRETQEEDRVTALYLRMSVAECQLLLHHPSLCRSTSSQTWTNNLDICLDASATMLSCGSQLKALKGLDTTWYYATTFLAAIFTTLFIYTQRHDQITSGDFQKLKADMDQWLDVLVDVGSLLGTGPRLSNTVRNTIDHSLDTLNKHIAAKTASAAVASTEQMTNDGAATAQPKQEQSWENGGYYNGYTNGAAQDTTNESMTANGNAPGLEPRNYSTESSVHLEQTPSQQYATPTRFSYQDPHPESIQQYSAAGNSGAFDTPSYSTDDVKPSMERSIEAQLNALAPQSQQQLPTAQPPHGHLQPQGASFMNGYSNPVQTQGGFQTGNMAPFTQPGGPAAWRDFATNMATNVGVGGVGFMAATAPMFPSTETSHVNHGVVIGGMQMPADGQQSWPQIQYDMNGGPVNGQ
ncbi:Hypothetical protein R9X50_00449800 [Acrodontium crateriforme]|uniref:Zn(2)-C6 fungal-type domain-containing protein n=1 Tax=Acrodontium crateriforme TaxID=150365 RepID=A0AAQ3RCT2_9PEZI|nr:Hypothetical protein R9X50_00449800 [Acrodontium crateriforme]